ncbi:MAG TPA: CHAD domain-containing protein [Chitinophagaceae bacterium]|nr:CHAD domain-containing protein [Chitinophagaceae bacterium]
MLSKTEQAKYLNRELTSIRKFLVGLKSAEPGKKQIHDVRINIKKIVALIELNKIRGYQAGNLPLLGMRSLFKTTGAIRSSQIILNNLGKSEFDNNKIYEHHEEIVKTNARKLVDQASAHLKMLFAFRNEMTLKKLHALQNSEILLYHDLKAEYLKQVFKTPLNPGHLHEGRKQIKHILYIQEMITVSLRKQLPFNMKNLELLQAIIGKWHDTVMFINCLHEFGVEKKNRDLKEWISKEKEQFTEISLFRTDKNNQIFIP